MTFKPLVQGEFLKMAMLKDTAQAKIKEAWTSQHDNPKLYAEIMMEFHNTFTDCDKNQNGVLELPEFKEFWGRNQQNMKRRFGDVTKSTDQEVEAWFAAYNMINKNKEGVSLADFKVGEYVMMVIGKMMSIDYAKEKFDPLVEAMMRRF